MSALHIHFGKPTALPLDMLLSMIPSLPRHALDRLVERAIDHMDDQDGDGDGDVEANGDELDGTGGEDDFIDRGGELLGGSWTGLGCPVGDPGGGEHDGREPEEPWAR